MNLADVQKQLSEVKQAKKSIDQLLSKNMKLLPENKKKEAQALLSKARKNNVKIGNIIKFVGQMSASDKIDLEARFKESKNVNFTA